MFFQLCLPFSGHGKHVAREDLDNTLQIGKPALPYLYEVQIMKGIQVSHSFCFL